MEFVKTPKISKVTCLQHSSKDSVTGTLFLTDRNLIFVEENGARERSILYHHIESVEQQAGSVRGLSLIIRTKTFLQLHLLIPKMAECQEVIDVINRFSQPLTYKQLYAFSYRPGSSEGATRVLGWGMYDTIMEYGRMGVPNEHWRHCSLNEEYKLCDTYTRHLYVPASASDAVISGSAGFRSKERFPILSYYYAPRKSALCRCSQPLSGIRKRCTEDEELVDCIFKANPNGEPVVVVDTRPKINAMANKAAGKGYESAENYTSASYVSFGIHNIHVMKDSLQKMMEVVYSRDLTVSELLQGLENSGWLRHIHLVMEAALFVVKFICDRGISILVHCSHGWDRTSQTCALASLWMDPHYRTLHGFMTLIEKEWLSCGHQFSLRCGHLKGESKETSPIFTQFLECVWQSMLQYPMSFEFNEQFLLLLHDNLYSCQFGTFLGNSERERTVQQFSAQTYSLWGYVWEHIDDYKNPLYNKAAESGIIRPDHCIPKLRFWRGLYARHICSHSSELKDDMVRTIRLQNMILQEHIKFLQQHVSILKASVDQGCVVNTLVASYAGKTPVITSDRQKNTAGEMTTPTAGEMTTPTAGEMTTSTAGEMTTPNNQSITQLDGLRSSGAELSQEGVHSKEINDEQVAELLLEEVVEDRYRSEKNGELMQLGLEGTGVKQEATELMQLGLEGTGVKQEATEQMEQEIIVESKAEQRITELKQKIKATNEEIVCDMKQGFFVDRDENTDSQDVMEERKKQIPVEGREQRKEKEKEPNKEEGKEQITEEKEMADVSQHDVTLVQEAIEQTDKITEEIKQECTEEVVKRPTQKKITDMVTQDIPVGEEETTVRKKKEEESVTEVRLNEAIYEGHASIQAEEHLDMLGKLKKYTQPISTLKTEWVALRNVNCCKCGMEFSYSTKKYNCTVCGEVVCYRCGNYHKTLQYVITSNHFRMCKTCYSQ